jgi:hypothetical protein
MGAIFSVAIAYCVRTGVCSCKNCAVERDLHSLLRTYLLCLGEGKAGACLLSGLLAITFVLGAQQKRGPIFEGPRKAQNSEANQIEAVSGICL